MPAFSRGLDGFLRQHALRLPSSLRAALYGTREAIFQPNFTRNTRYFNSTVLRRYQYPRSKLAPKPSSFVNNDPVLRQVVQTRKTVVLYEAPKNKWYYLKVYGTGALWIGVGAYSIKFNDDIKDRGLSDFVRPTYVVIGVAFIIIGCYICTAPSNRMRVLEVTPSLQGGPMQLRMTVRPAPWLSERVIYSNIGSATISEKTEPMVHELLEAERFRRQKIWDEDLKHLSIVGKAWEGSARWLYQTWTNFFLKFKFAVLRFGIAKVKVQGEEWKIDCSGWLLENGKAVDRLISEE